MQEEAQEAAEKLRGDLEATAAKLAEEGDRKVSFCGTSETDGQEDGCF